MDLELIDGNPVVSHVVRFKDRTEISDRDAESVKDGAVVVWIVRTRCQPPSYHPVKKDSEDRYRFNIQTVEAAAVLHGELRDGALAYLDDPTQSQGRFVFDSPTYGPADGPAEIRDNFVFREVDLQRIAEPPEPVTVTVADLTDLADDPLDEGTVRVVGNVYGNRESETHKLMSEKWDDL